MSEKIEVIENASNSTESHLGRKQIGTISWISFECRDLSTRFKPSKPEMKPTSHYYLVSGWAREM